MDDSSMEDFALGNIAMLNHHPPMDDLINTWSLRAPTLSQFHSQPQFTQPPKLSEPPNHRFTPAEWEKQKPVIRKLYSEDGQILADVRKILQQSGFDAT
jgi:hypothetical protein